MTNYRRVWRILSVWISPIRQMIILRACHRELSPTGVIPPQRNLSTWLALSSSCAGSGKSTALQVRIALHKSDYRASKPSAYAQHAIISLLTYVHMLHYHRSLPSPPPVSIVSGLVSSHCLGVSCWGVAFLNLPGKKLPEEYECSGGCRASGYLRCGFEVVQPTFGKSLTDHYQTWNNHGEIWKHRRI